MPLLKPLKTLLAPKGPRRRSQKRGPPQKRARGHTLRGKTNGGVKERGPLGGMARTLEGNVSGTQK